LNKNHPIKNLSGKKTCPVKFVKKPVRAKTGLMQAGSTPGLHVLLRTLAVATKRNSSGNTTFIKATEIRRRYVEQYIGYRHIGYKRWMV
jgi:hypothetical protein